MQRFPVLNPGTSPLCFLWYEMFDVTIVEMKLLVENN